MLKGWAPDGTFVYDPGDVSLSGNPHSPGSVPDGDCAFDEADFATLLKLWP
jgi:hypothetical protein